MNSWLRRIRGAVLMALTWAVVWAPVGVLIGMIVDPDGSMEEIWVAVGCRNNRSRDSSALLARMAKKRKLRDASADVA